MKKVNRVVLTVLILATFSCWGAAALANDGTRHGDPSTPVTDDDKIYLGKIKDAIANNRKDWLVNEVSLPLNCFIDGHRVTIKTKEQFLAYYDQILDVYVRESVNRQDANGLFKNWQGIMIGSGAIWFDRLGSENGANNSWAYSITAINNVPPSN